VCDLFVPTEHTHAFPDHRATQPGLLYCLPIMSVFAWTVAVVPLGIARSAISSFGALAGRKVRAGATVPLAEREIVQDGVGRAETLHAAARSLLIEAMGELMRATDAGGDRLIRARALFRAACTFAAESAVRVVDSLAASAGAAAISETCALERCVRDVQAAVKHVAMSPNNYVVAGRVCLGKEPGTTRF
ncbi:MAG TPA: acyl-CoA dehydrogenase family protein, partial [Vineibacter sp.]|nr:acyl-CoA dehydrogenase family protein [Vineibacter sp.]